LEGGHDHRKTSTYTRQHNLEKHGHISMPREGMEPTIPMFEMSKIMSALDRAATGTGEIFIYISKHFGLHGVVLN
jgi:hypothetical protein